MAGYLSKGRWSISLIEFRPRLPAGKAGAKKFIAGFAIYALPHMRSDDGKSLPARGS